VALSVPVIGACAVEFHATLSHAPALDLNSADLSPRKYGCEIERQSSAERQQDMQTGLGERV
jgi:hypothetical protein